MWNLPGNKFAKLVVDPEANAFCAVDIFGNGGELKCLNLFTPPAALLS